MIYLAYNESTLMKNAQKANMDNIGKLFASLFAFTLVFRTTLQW
jgi:hypothetical protein